MEETERCELAVMTIQRRKLGRWVIYILLLLFRFLGVFQRGYVHPDEFFQGGQELFFGRNRHESDGRYLTRDFVVKSVPWEFESKHAVRSIVPPAFMTLLPLRLYATLRHRFSMSFLVDGDLVITGQESPRESSSSSLWMKSPAIENLSGVEILLVPRFFMAFLSVIFLDGSLWLLLSITQRGTIRAKGPPIEVLVLASSWPCLVFGMRPFTNCLESMMVAFLIVIVAAMVDCGETNHLKVKPTTKRMNDDAFFSLILIGATCSVGIFIRFTFSFFAFPVLVLFLWRRWKFLGGCRVKLMIHDVSLLSVSFLLVSFAFAWVDNQYYTRQSKSACDNNICEAEPEFSSGSMLDYIAPFNAFLYNSNPANLAKHGLHPRITHLGGSIKFSDAVLLSLHLHS
jgi:phosphatidylinositol glycan class Z